MPKKKPVDLPADGPDAPSVRLSITHDGMPSKEDRYPAALGPQPPTVRLAHLAASSHQSVDNTTGTKMAQAFNPPAVRLAHVPGAQGDNVLLGQRGVDQLPDDSKPALLVSYFYLKPFLENRHRYAYRDWVMDSGAFSAMNSGVDINLNEFVAASLELMQSDPTMTEVFALDVIGDWKASIKNCEYMWSKGVPAIPTFHYGSPWDVLKGIAKDYPKIAVGGCVGRRDKDSFAQQCFARVWPTRIHGFGFGSEKSLMMLPWHSVDATNWELAPCKFGHWKAFGGQRVSVRGSSQNLRAEVEWYLALEKRARQKWRKQMIELEETRGPCCRLALSGASDEDRTVSTKDKSREITFAPVVRLAHKESGREDGKFLTEEPGS